MDSRVQECVGLTADDIHFLHRVEAGLRLTADISRADALLCCLLTPHEALVVQHARPRSISSLYREPATGQLLRTDDQPLLFRALKNGSGGHQQKEIRNSGAPIIQDVQPITNPGRRVIGALLFETNMLAYERQRRRNRSFRQAVIWLQQMCLAGELESTRNLSRFGLYDGIYLVDHRRVITYVNGIAGNMLRSIGLMANLQGKPISELETVDEEMAENAFSSRTCQEQRTESDDGRVWIRKAIPLTPAPTGPQDFWLNLPWLGQRGAGDTAAVLVLVHNATEAVEKQRELNVKSAIIQEVHHRVKNNLQTIAAMLRIQARRSESEETKQALGGAVNRILSMSVIHEFLSQDEHRPINIRDVCQRITDQVTRVAGSPDQEIDIRVQGPTIRLPASQATPMAMVVNELLLNALEHGLAEAKKGEILIELGDLGDAVQIVVQDDGAGLPPGFDPEQSKSLGLQIVHTLVTDDLKGELRLETVSPQALPASEEIAGQTAPPPAQIGTRAIVTFPKRSLRVD